MHHSTPYKLLISAALIIPAILFTLIVWQDYHSVMDASRTEVIRTAEIFEQHALNVFETHQLVCERINDRIKNMSWGEIEHSSDLSNYLTEIEKKYPQVIAIWLADANGVIRNASMELPDEPVSVADRDYFKELKLNKNNKAADIFIGHIVKPRVMKILNFNVAYRRSGSDGNFDGVIIVTASPEYFSNFWNSVISQKNSAAILLRSDGAVLSRSLGLDPNRLNMPPDSPAMKAISSASSGSFVAQSVHDGTERVFGFQKVEKFNTFVIYGVSMKSVLRIWHRHTAIYGGFFGIAAMLLALFALSARKHSRELQESEEALQESEKIYRAIGESIDYGIWVCDADGRNLYASESFLKLVGITQEQCSNFGWADLLHPDDAEHTMALWKECVRVDGFWDIEHRYRGADGKWHPILARGVPVKDDNGRTINWVGINLDISRSKAAEDELKKLNDDLDHLVTERTQELNEKNAMLIHQSRLAAMGEMIQNIAHQWRQPLNTLGLNVQTLQILFDADKLDKSHRDKIISNAMSLILHMSKTIDDFRNFFKPDKDKEEFNVTEVIKNAIQLVEASFQNYQIKIIENYQNDSVSYGYPNEYSQVILNILVNAKDAFLANKTDNPEVSIISRFENGKSVVTISDNAGGIAENIILKVFDPHFTTKGPQGTGIGLFMAKNIIEKNMDGRLSVSNSEAGAVFRIEV